MAISPGKKSCVSLEELLNVTTEADIASKYLNIHSIPCVINSPLRKDNNPSFGLYSPDGSKVKFIDFATKQSGSLFDLFCLLWGKSFQEVINDLYDDLPKNSNTKITITNSNIICSSKKKVELKCKIRDWMDYDLEYWSSYGISLEWLKYANVYPISHKIILKDGNKYVFTADKYAYAYVEFKEGKTTLKIYQPFNNKGFKWANCHDKSVLSLWTKLPNDGDRVCICASLKDALCLWSNTGIPCIALQGEGYPISNTAINELKKRFNKVYICLDADETGIKDAEILASKTGFINVVLPIEYHQKDISDLYKSLENKDKFKNIMLNLFKN